VSEQDLFGDVPTAPTARSRPSRPAAAGPGHTWFFALRPDAADAARIDAFAERLLASYGLTPGKRIGPDRLHITLELVGHDVDANVVEAACRAADSLRLPPFEVRMDAARTFPAPSGPFVLLCSEGSDGLQGAHDLRMALAFSMADHGFKPGRSYQPHMTLCYDPRHRVELTGIAPLSVRFAEFALVKSHIGFSRHEVLRTWALQG
jgi:2'-5' RNA ligase